MTIIAASLRLTFAVIVVERLWHGTDGATGYDPKFVVHPTLPMAIGTAGFREMPDGRLVTSHLNDLIASLTAAQLTMDGIWATLTAYFVGPVRQMRAALGPNPSGHLDFYIALAREGVAALRVMRIDHDPAVRTGPQWLDGPAHIGAFYKANGMLKSAYIFGDAGWDEEHVVDRLVHIVRSGIDCDAHSGLPHRYAGGTIDVVIVRAAGVEHREISLLPRVVRVFANVFAYLRVNGGRLWTRVRQ